MNSSTEAGLAATPPAADWLEDGAGGRLAFTTYPAPTPWLHLLISHGFGEHRGWYDHVGRAFQGLGISAYTFDHFHHGLSSSVPSDMASYDDLTSGVRLALEQGVLPRARDGAPVALLGHSNGGLAVLRAMQTHPPNHVSAVVLVNPLLAIPRRVSRWGVPVATWLGHLWPTLRMPVRSVPERLTADPSIWPGYARDPLRFKTVTLRFFLAMAREAALARRETAPLGVPLLLMVGGRDEVVSRGATEQWFARLEEPAKQRLEYSDLLHELFNEACWRDIVADAAGWLRERIAPAHGSAASARG